MISLFQGKALYYHLLLGCCRKHTHLFHLSIPNMFGLYPSEYNYAGPRKRPLSSITPTIIEKDARFEMAIGGSGGSIIPTATLNVSQYILIYIPTTCHSNTDAPV